MSHRLLLSLFTALLAALVMNGPRQLYRNFDQAIAIRPVALDSGDPARRRVGALTFMGAWELSSDNQDFGGISALLAMPDGRFIGVGDGGTLIGFGLTGDDRIDRPFIAPLPGKKEGRDSYKNNDAESVTRDPASGRFWVGFEQRHAVRRYAPAFSRVEAVMRPAAMQRWPENGGAESLVRLNDGRFLIISERQEALEGGNAALIFAGEPDGNAASIAFAYVPPEGYAPTDAAQLPDGKLLILNRKIALPGFSAAIVLADPNDIVAGGQWRGEEIARLESPLTVDNMEGIAITRERGRNIVWLVSDDNFTILQRTLLMKFALDVPEKKRTAPPAPGFETIGK